LAIEGSVTQKEIPNQEPFTVREPGATLADLGTTIIQGTSAGHGETGGLEIFRGWPVLSQLPTKGAEADIFQVKTEDATRVLKLYRHRLEPKLEILNKIVEISRRNSRYFVIFLETGFDEKTGRWYELQEYMPLGSLRDLPAETRRESAFIFKMVGELAGAIHCLHENGIIHCDMKPANVLVRSLDPLDLVLTDFGISSLLASDVSQKMTGLKGTPMYWAPEAFSRIIGRPCDWWGLGMIVLELLAGEHPLEGLNDSQIIHKLTLGNVEVPENLDPAWALLVKGLLTKDDSLRWGMDEVSRWLAGERGIQVFYENRAAGSTDAQSSFRFEGKEYFSAGDLAAAFSASEKPWTEGWDYLRYVRQWYERNMLFDEALELGKAIGNDTPELALFRFIHRNARLPFSVMGKIVDFGNLRLFTGRAIRHEASQSESRIVQMLCDGSLAGFYGEYAAMTGQRDAFFENLLLFMAKKPLADIWGYLEAINDPDSFLWPEDAGSETAEERLEAIKGMGVIPIGLAEFEAIKADFILPDELLYMLRTGQTFASGTEQLKRWQEAGMLFPSGSCSDPAQREMYEHLSLGEYEGSVRLLRLGHTPAIVEKLGSLKGSFESFTPPRDYPSAMMFFRTMERLNGILNRRITPKDTQFVADASALFEERRSLEDGRWVRYAAGSAAGGALLLLASYISGGSTGILTGVLTFFAVILGGLYFLAFGGGNWQNASRAELYFSFLILGVYIAAWASIPFPFFVWAIWGFGIAHGLYRYALLKNSAAILETCASYSSPLSGGENDTGSRSGEPDERSYSN
jgi:tRNA A-37 threonylcarbamoyl transferase component Bud32